MKNLLAIRRLRQFGRADEGQALVLTAVALVVLMLMAGLGIDVGFLRYQKQQMQKAADAGAIAGASELIYGTPALAKVAAQNDTSANGFTNGNNGTTIQVNIPPASGPFAGDNSYVEVIVAQAQPTFFMRVGGFNAVNVRGRAVAAIGSSSGCIYALDPTDSGTFLVDGNDSVLATCGILVESSSQTALTKPGASGTVQGSTIGVVGGYSGSGFHPTPTTGIAPFDDPLANVCSTISSSSCPELIPAAKCVNYTNQTTISPNTYCGGITLPANATYTFQPGVYILLGGGLTANGNQTLNGSGVVFYNTWNGTYSYGGVSIGGNVTVNLSAPTTGSEAAILFFQDRSVPAPTKINNCNQTNCSSFLGTTGESFSGALYFPTTGLEFKGTPGVSDPAVLVGWTVEFKGDTQMNDDLLPDGGSPILSAVLVE